MEDRYLFKAKELDNGEWVQGNYVKCLDEFANCEEAHIIFEPNAMFYSSGEIDGWYKVDPSTICQCTGLRDKNGNLIWENDIVKGKYYDGGKAYEHMGQRRIRNARKKRNKSIKNMLMHMMEEYARIICFTMRGLEFGRSNMIRSDVPICVSHRMVIAQF